ncbi:ATP-binding protein [Nostoc sp.]|uniref:ATP-binding protein n=1 Tax=Nostoc sp. TaxID=1180 RepID=UPI002FF9159F
MTGRSLKASLKGIEQANKALTRNALGKKALALELGIARSTVHNFFSGKPVDRLNFEEICKKLGLNWEKIVDIPANEPRTEQLQDTTINNNNFVGREDAIAHLNNLVNEGAKVILIHAEGGIGKTTLATKWFELQRLEYLELRVGSTPQNLNSVEDWVRIKLINYFKVNPEQNFITMLEQLKIQLKARKIGVLIDNLEPALINGEFIEPYYSYYVELLTLLGHKSVQSITLITSREQIYEHTVKRLQTFTNYKLDGLKQESWQQYFETCKISINDAALSEMHQAYGGNAEAMVILSPEIVKEAQGNLKVYWQDNREDILRYRTIEKLVQRQFDKLKNDNIQAYKLLCRFGFYPNQDITVPKVWLFCLLWDVPKNRRQRVIDDLCDRSLIKNCDDEYYLHTVIRVASVENFSLLIKELNNSQLPLIKQQVDAILEGEPELQLFLVWVQQKSSSVKCTFNQPSIRAFYFYLALSINYVIDHLCPNPVVAFFEDDFNPEIAFVLGLKLTEESNEFNDIYLDIELAYAFGDAPKKTDFKHYCLEPDLVKLLQNLEKKILDYSSSMDFLYGGGYENSWQDDWSNEVKDLAGKLRLMLIKYRNIGHDWKFTERQRDLVQQYYNANKLLVYCLNSASDQVRSHIEDTLLLPIAKIEKRPFKN